MKSLHIQFVAKCKNKVECRFGWEKCSFTHNEDIEIAYQNAKSEGQINDNNVIMTLNEIEHT